MPIRPTAWLLLILSLPTQSATGRMRIWRSVKSLGCAPLRDGAYLLPRSPAHEAAFDDLAETCVREGGTAWVTAAAPLHDDEADAYVTLFDRSEAYAGLIAAWQEAARTLAKRVPSELTRLQKRLCREYEAIRSIDFFPNDASTGAEAAWRDFSARVDRHLSPDEPHEVERSLPRLQPADYLGRLWATRKRLWVDRVASAWLIRRFIDDEARFRWLDKPSDCPRKALGFDFDDATFTHVGDRVTFETLTASFGLDDDPALARLGAMVHSLDVGGDPVAEAAGFEAVLAGARDRLPDDDVLLGEIGAVLDSLYMHFQQAGLRDRAGWMLREDER